MQDTKTNHKAIRGAPRAQPVNKPEAAIARQAPAPPREGDTASGATETIQALERLGKKLDQAAALLQQQLEAWGETPATEGSRPVQHEAPGGPAVREPEREGGGSIAGARPARQSGPDPETTESQHESIPAGPPSPPESAAAANLADDARQVLNTLSRSQNSWREPLADLRQALDAIMGYLENQAAASPPPIDVSDILSRLRNLEEEQKNLQSQHNTSRWGP